MFNFYFFFFLNLVEYVPLYSSVFLSKIVFRPRFSYLSVLSILLILIISIGCRIELHFLRITMPYSVLVQCWYYCQHVWLIFHGWPIILCSLLPMTAPPAKSQTCSSIQGEHLMLAKCCYDYRREIMLVKKTVSVELWDQTTAITPCQSWQSRGVCTRQAGQRRSGSSGGNQWEEGRAGAISRQRHGCLFLIYQPK